MNISGQSIIPIIRVYLSNLFGKVNRTYSSSDVNAKEDKDFGIARIQHYNISLQDVNEIKNLSAKS